MDSKFNADLCKNYLRTITLTFEQILSIKKKKKNFLTFLTRVQNSILKKMNDVRITLKLRKGRVFEFKKK